MPFRVKLARNKTNKTRYLKVSDLIHRYILGLQTNIYKTQKNGKRHVHKIVIDPFRLVEVDCRLKTTVRSASWPTPFETL